ncbi:MAG: hypothetical protein IPN53_11440 [Comamonadaceae bacterium]|nr:hypothetical protein [Comamonadaceae bacterium]
MIRIIRGSEPAKLVPLRIAKLAVLGSLGREPTSDEVVGYKEVATELWDAQHHKCCYCEQRIPKGFNDVEHYRPKCRADRRPGCAHTHGYWWLAFSWDNLLFACPACNRSGKNDLFPLIHGSISLLNPLLPPGNELPLLLDPGSAINPVEHIEYTESAIGRNGGPTHWWARPRNASIYGVKTIEVCELNRLELRELRNDHFRSTLAPQVEALNNSFRAHRLENTK